MRPFRVLCFALCFLFCAGQSRADSRADSSTVRRARVVNVALSIVGIREVGRNAGAAVERIIRFAGGKVHDAYCSWTVVYNMRMAGVLVPRFGKAKSWFDPAHTVWRKGQQLAGKPAPRPGDVLGFTWGHPEVCHAETLVGVWGTGPAVRAVGGNTGGGGALRREGEGIYLNWRLKRLVAAVANVVDNPAYTK